MEAEKQRPNSADRLTVVGVGASAGGLEALTELLEQLSPSSAMAFVLIQHLDPRHESLLPDLLSAKTPMRVVPVQQDIPIQANHVYIISPDTILRVQDDHLVPEKRPSESYRPIDEFFDSLAKNFKECAVGIVLSGTASDGTLGLKRIKA
jgi:two-component system CheB/CheR fusion protein